MNEQELIQGLRNADETAFKFLVDTYQDRIFNTAIGTFKMPECLSVQMMKLGNDPV